MQKNRTETNLSDENRLLKQKIKSLQSELKNRENLDDSKDNESIFFQLIGAFIILVCLYPFFRFGWFLINFNHF